MAMPNGPCVNVNNLRAAVNLCLDAIEREFGPDVELGADHYWLLELTQVFDLSSRPVPNAGQLSDDVSELDAALREDVQIEVATWHTLSHIL